MPDQEQSPDAQEIKDFRSVDVASKEQDDEVDELLRQIADHESNVQAPRIEGNWPRWILERRATDAASDAIRPSDAPAKSGEAEPDAGEWRRIEAEMARRDRRLDFERTQAERRALDGAVAGPPHNDELDAALAELLGDDYAEAPATAASPGVCSEGLLVEALDEPAPLRGEMRCGEGHSASISDLTSPGPDEPTPTEGVIRAGATELEDKLQALISGTQHMRWTRAAFRSQWDLKQTRSLALKLSKRVFGAAWLPSSGADAAKKFPFSPKSYSSSSKRGCSAFKEEWELSPQIRPERIIPAPLPSRPTMPAWEKLPALEKRTPELSEVIAGARFTSIAFRGEITPQDWAHSLPGSDVLCMSIDLRGEAAERFLSGEHGDVGKSLKRRLLRRLDDRGRFFDLAVGAIWTNPSASSDTVRVFMMFQNDDVGSAGDMEIDDRNRRFWMSLQRHKVSVSPDGMRLIVSADQLAPYLGITVGELEDRWEVTCYDGGVPEIEEYTPEEGFPTPNVLKERREQSYRKWAHFVSQRGLPAWISPRFMELVKDYFCFAPEHVKRRNRLRAAKKKRKFVRRGFTKAQVAELKRLKLMEQSPGGEICIFRCSPAQFAAIAVRDGEVLGEYFDSAHKAGRSKELYEAIRREWLESPVSASS